MITYCSNCGINWARLWEEEMNNTDETVEFCPQCKSSMHLQPGTDIVAYIKCCVSGAIVDALTGNPHPAETPVRPPGKPRRVKVWDETMEEFQDRTDDEVDKAIEAGTFYGYSKPVRKHHFEEIN